MYQPVGPSDLGVTTLKVVQLSKLQFIMVQCLQLLGNYNITPLPYHGNGWLLDAPIKTKHIYIAPCVASESKVSLAHANQLPLPRL